MTAPSPFRAAQQPLPTCEETRTKEVGWAAERFWVFIEKSSTFLSHWPRRIHTPPPAFLQTWHQSFASTWKSSAGGYCGASHPTCLWSQHNSLPVQYGLFAAVNVVKLLLGHGVVHVHGRDAQFAGFGQLVQPETPTETSALDWILITWSTLCGKTNR